VRNKWVDAPSRYEAGRMTGLTYETVRGAIDDGKPRLGKGGHYYEFIDLSKPPDIGSFVEVRVRPELLQLQPHTNIRRSYLGRSFVDKKTKDRFTVCGVFNNYDDDLDDHSLRLSLWFYDAKKYKKKPAKSQWDWCYVASMAADGYKFVDGSPWAGHVSKKRKSPKTRSK